MDGANVGAWIAALAGAIALISQGFQALRNRQKERTQIEVALDQQPHVRQQLELGNVGEAVKHLNVIIGSQAQHIEAQDEELAKLRRENAELRLEVATLRMEIGRMHNYGPSPD